MSEYQYYEFQALDRPLTQRDREALRAISSRARITATSFTNSYEWGDFKGSPEALMARWFDLHLYLANWGSRRLMIRLPARLVDAGSLRTFLDAAECAELKRSGEHLVLNISRDELELDDGWDDGSGWLAVLAPLRADIVGGDLRLFYLLWLTAVEDGSLDDAAVEPMPGIGPITGPLEAFARFFAIDPDLVTAASERSGDSPAKDTLTSDAVRRAVASLSEEKKTGLLLRLFEGDPHAGSELRAQLRGKLKAGCSGPPLRTAGELRNRAQAIDEARKQAEAKRQQAERRRKEEEEERARRLRLDAIAKRGEAVWREIENEIERRNAPGYDTAARLLRDIKTIAEENGTAQDFSRRLGQIRERHARKERFIERLRGF